MHTIVSVISLWASILFRNRTNSDYGKISCGVAQGSILGSLIFLIHVNDMPQTIVLNLFLYSDDSCLMYQHRDAKEIEKQLKKKRILKMFAIGSLVIN